MHTCRHLGIYRKASKEHNDTTSTLKSRPSSRDVELGIGAHTDHDSTCTSDPETSSNSSYENEDHGSVDLMDTLVLMKLKGCKE